MTTDQEFDLSQVVLERFMDFHVVTVAAVQGGRVSENVSKTFTFNGLTTADVQCKKRRTDVTTQCLSN